MRSKVLAVLALVSMLTMGLAACGATPEPIVNTVVVQQTVPVKETVIVKETSVVKETAVVQQTVEVVITPRLFPTRRRSLRASSQTPRSQSGLSGCHRPLMTISRLLLPASRKRIPASK